MDYKEKVIALLNSQELSKEQKEKLESIFPELKESIRKRIIALVNAHGQGMYKDDMLAWLEKQGETFQILSNSSNIGKNEQKPAEWSKEDIQMYCNVLFYLSKPSPLTEVNGKSREQLLDWFKSLKSRVQPQKQEWSEEDERVRIALFLFVEAYGAYANYDVTQEEMLDWLKSLKDRVLPQPKQEWKPSDEQMNNK